ncbi:MAG: ATP-binding protein [Acidobacteria bacterium]|nr:ATP-binding protein [Acidobacteriota bacterium]
MTRLMESCRSIAGAANPDAFNQRMGLAMEQLFTWSAFVVIPGDGGMESLDVQGGRRLGAQGRHFFAEEIRQSSRAESVILPHLRWQAEPATGADARGAPSLIFPFTGRGGRRGLLAVLPADGVVPDAGARRLVASLAQQAGVWWERWRHGEEDRRTARDALLEQLPCGVILLDESGRVAALNGVAGRLLAQLSGPEPAAGRSMEQLGLPLGSLPRNTEVEFSGCRDQRRYTLRWDALPGTGESISVVLSDVTAERGAREQAMQAEKMSVIGEMLSGVAHELNNPLASVLGFSQLLLSQCTDEWQHQRLSLVVAEAQRARRVVTNLLDVARVRPPERVAVSLDELVTSILALFAYPFRVDDIEVEWHPAPNLPPVSGDRARLQQVMVNLVSNAHHALRHCDKPRRLIVRADEAAGRVRLQVSDNGGGIPESHLDRIFTPFFTTKAVGAGTGLGLAICARIAEEHGGTIHVRSQVGEGATFLLDLPACRIPAPRQVKPGAPPVEVAGLRRLLVVDDEDAFRQLLQEALSEHGTEVVTAADGAAALEEMAAGSFDAVVSDLRMPGMNGMEFHEQVKQRWPAMARRFVFITGDVMDADVRAFLESCGAPHLPKPFGLQELTDTLVRVVLAGNEGTGAVLDFPEGNPGETAT